MKIQPFAKLRNADLRGENLRSVDLSYSDLRGANLIDADLQHAVLSHSELSYADLRSANLKQTNLMCVDLSFAYFRNANLQRADISHANIYNASFPNARLKGIRHEYNVPTIENIHTKVLDAVSAKGNGIDMADWHDCESTHCYAGWVIHLAGEQGYALEEQIGSSAAAALIMQASDPDLEQIPDWHQSEDDALKQMRALAEKEAA